MQRRHIHDRPVHMWGGVHDGVLNLVLAKTFWQAAP